MAADDASRRDQTVYGLAHSAATRPKDSEIHGSGNSQFLTTGRNQFKFLESAPDLGERLLTANALKNLTEIEVSQAESLPENLVVEPLCFAIPQAAKKKLGLLIGKYTGD